MKHSCLFLCATLMSASLLFAQRPQPSPGVGNAVLLATNSIQLDRGVSVLSGDVVVNAATSGPVLGESALSLDRDATTPAGYKLAATSIDLDRGAVAGGDVYYNALTNDGSIAGARFTPLALPVFAVLPPALVRSPGASDVVVPDGKSITLSDGAYGNLVVGRNASVSLTGGGYAFRSISVARGGALRAAAAADLVVRGRADFGTSSAIGPASGSGLTAAAIRVQVDGINGADGALLSTPPAIHIGQASSVLATLYATAGSLILDQDVVGTGAFLGRDIRVASGGRLTIASAFNQPPIADPQSVVTNGSAPLQITLTATDPEGGALTFSIVSGPSAGTLSTPLQISPASAGVTYTPSAPNVADSFTFRVRDGGGASGDAVVTINSPRADPPPPAPTTVTALAGAADTTKDVPASLLLRGSAPAGVALTFSIVANSGPSHGSLGAVVQGAEVPQRSAVVVYTPDAGFTGNDAFQFQACGVISGAPVCDTAAVAIRVLTARVEPPAIAHDVEVSTFANGTVLISLGGDSIQGAMQRVLLAPRAAFLDPVTIAGNVADANGDGFGDNANALPGSAPVFMSAGVHQSGGAGSNGTVRMQFEWNMSAIAGSASALQSATVILPTHRGTVDSADTHFYWVGASGDGSLTNSDFQAPAEAIAGAVMPVPPSMAVDAEGTFSFSVLDQVREAARLGFTHFAIQGRVDESASQTVRGLEVRTTASGNVATNSVPMIALATPGITPPLLFRITALPQSGVLHDGAGNLISTVPFELPSGQVSYAPNSGFLGLDTFAFDVSNGFSTASAFVHIHVLFSDCEHNPSACNNGR